MDSPKFLSTYNRRLKKINYSFGSILLAAGLTGFWMKKSIVSLLMSTIFAVIFWIMGIVLVPEKEQIRRWCQKIGILTLLIFLTRYLLTLKLYPSGVLLFLNLIYLYIFSLNNKKMQRYRIQ